MIDLHILLNMFLIIISCEIMLLRFEDLNVCNLSQVFKNSLWGSQWRLSQNMIKTLWLTLGEWSCALDNDPKLVVGHSKSR